jgi:hypothetical protein
MLVPSLELAAGIHGRNVIVEETGFFRSQVHGN